MTKKKNISERQVLGTILLGLSAFTGVMSIVFIIRFIFFDDFMSVMMAKAIAWTMLYGTFVGLGMNYTIQVPRGKESDGNQMILWLVLIVLGTVICATMQQVISIGGYIVLPIVFYAQNWIMFLVGLYSMKYYRKEKL